MTNPRRSIVSEIDVSSAPFIAGPPSSSVSLPLWTRSAPAFQTKRRLRAGDTPSAKASEVSDTPSETPGGAVVMNPRCHMTTTSGGACYSPYLWVICATTRGVAWGVRFLPQSHRPCQAQTLPLPGAGDPEARRDQGARRDLTPDPGLTSQVRERRPSQKPTRKLPCRTSVFDS